MKHCKLIRILLAVIIALGCIDAGCMMHGTDVQAKEMVKFVGNKDNSTVKIPDNHKDSVSLMVEKRKITISGGKRMKRLNINAQGGTIKEVKFTGKLEKLKELHVYLDAVKKIDFGKMPNLEKIGTGSGGAISNAKKGILKLNGLNKLKDINFMNNSVNSNPIYVTNCKRLKNVSCRGHKINIKNCPKLKSVNCQYGKASIKKSPNIVSIDLGTDGKMALKDIYGCKKLKKLVAGKSIINKLDKSKLPKLKKIVIADEESDEE